MFGIAESLLSRFWTFNLTCHSVNSGVILAIPVENFYEVLDSDELLDEKMTLKAMKLQLKMIHQIRNN